MVAENENAIDDVEEARNEAEGEDKDMQRSETDQSDSSSISDENQNILTGEIVDIDMQKAMELLR